MERDEWTKMSNEASQQLHDPTLRHLQSEQARRELRMIVLLAGILEELWKLRTQQEQ